MNRVLDSCLSRRTFLAGSAALLLTNLGWSQMESDRGMYWKLTGEGDHANEAISGEQDPIASRTGHAIWVGEGRERALRLDGYSVWIEHASLKPGLDSCPLTICAWVALESYPVNTAALLQIGEGQTCAFSFCIDKWGRPHVGARSGSHWKEKAVNRPLRRHQWLHLAGTVSADGEIAIFIDGVRCGSLLLGNEPRHDGPAHSLVIGKSANSPLIGDLFPTGVLNGLLKDVRIYRAELSQRSLMQVMDEAKPEGEPNLQINGDWCGDDKQRPKYHAMPPRAWTNEPHGLIHFKGKYHLFYQKNANGPYWGNINWGHMTSPDLHAWTEQPVALSPEQGVDAEGCWSGSVIEHEGGLAILYTGGDGHRASICLATSTDGLHFTKHPGNPVIAAPPESGGYTEFRDPFVWREGDCYYVIVGSAVKDVGGTALLYRSRDLIHWEFRKPLLIGDRETSGVFWEMPVFVRVDDRHVLIVCEVPGRASYWVGTWKDEIFTPLSITPHRLELFNHLLSPTPHTFPNGEVITMGVIPDQRSPRECWSAGWAHLYSLPRHLSIDSAGRLGQRPWEGLSAFAAAPVTLKDVILRENMPDTLGGATGTSLHIRATVAREKSRSVEFILRRSKDDRERTVLRYDWEIGRLVLDRTQSSLDPGVTRDSQEATYFPSQDNILDIEVYLDVSVIEVFLDHRAAFAARIYPTLDHSEGVAMNCLGGDACVSSIMIARITGK